MSNIRRRVRKKNIKKDFDKYNLYFRSVQSPDTDVLFFRKVYRELRGSEPRVLREDFCGTFAVSCEWVKLNKKYHSIAVDLDPDPLEYGRNHFFKKLSDAQKLRVKVVEGNVLDQGLGSSDIVVALNFSYFTFKSRDLMKKYFTQVKKSLKKNGIFILDIFGGSLCYDQNEESSSFHGFKYFWDQENFDPISHRAQFHIHFKPKGQEKMEHVFTYDWRLWSIPELRELLEEVGFKKVHVYWEGTTKSGGGDGVFKRTEKGESCDSWIAYLAACV